MSQVLDSLMGWDSFWPTTPRVGGFSKSIGSFTQSAGAMDIWESDKGYHMEVELPGVSEEHLSLELLNRTLTIEVDQKQEAESNEDTKRTEKYYVKERRALNFTRTFSLPDAADGNSMKAQFSNGLLTIDIPRKAEAQPKKISIN